MDYFRRLFKYILPQYRRVIVVFITALLVAMLLSFSFMSIIPLLK